MLSFPFYNEDMQHSAPVAFHIDVVRRAKRFQLFPQQNPIKLIFFSILVSTQPEKSNILPAASGQAGALKRD
jgi:hypothetical protein